MNGKDIVTGIRANQRPSHDTLYCNNTHKQALLERSTGGLRADNLQISGLEVFTHERFELPITCERGQLFDLAEDYKCGDAEPDEL